MNRRDSFLSLGAGLAITSVGLAGCNSLSGRLVKPKRKELKADLVIIGGGLGGCAAALSALSSGLRVIMTEETDWIGGQLTSQGVPPDEHRWIESFGCTRTYRKFRNAIRDYYRRHYPLTDNARDLKNLNPGSGSVSRLCHEPRVALACLESLLAPFEVNGQLTLLVQTKPIAAELVSDNIRSVEVFNMGTGHSLILNGSIFADATELGDLLPLANCEFVTGTEGKKQTGELHMPDRVSPGNQQAFTMCFAVDHVVGAEHVIDKPKEYDFWSGYIPDLMPAWPGRLLDFSYTHPSSGASKQLGFNPKGPHKIGVINLWTYRRILAQSNFNPGSGLRDISLINWPQNDYFLGNLVGVSDAERNRHIDRSKQLSLSLLYWLQTEAPRDDGGEGWPGLRLRKDVMGTNDGLAKYPYVRESRRIRAMTTIVEQDCGKENRALVVGEKESQVQAKRYLDSVGIGHYQIDLHPSTGGDNYIDFAALPFELPLGALIPQRVSNLIASCKNIGTTHITNGCYRLHPIEWNIGEVAGHLAATAIANSVQPKAIWENGKLLSSFRDFLRKIGVETSWPPPQTQRQHG
ncbi:MAG: FAD-dependent oxidoreductase [Gammaproteobacteria bacterium]|nr:FAD-dependent oxidoreductase [Gammaproteobacteria bacterium]